MIQWEIWGNSAKGTIPLTSLTSHDGHSLAIHPISTKWGPQTIAFSWGPHNSNKHGVTIWLLNLMGFMHHFFWHFTGPHCKGINPVINPNCGWLMALTLPTHSRPWPWLWFPIEISPNWGCWSRKGWVLIVSDVTITLWFHVLLNKIWWFSEIGVPPNHPF